MSQTYTSDSLRAVGADKGIPDATVARLPVYLRALHQLADHGIDTVSSQALAEAAGVSSAQLRKDLSHLGSYGTRGVGYDVQYLFRAIGREVGSAHDWPVIIVGLGNLGTALANYSGFYSRGFRVVGLIDPNPELVGKRIHGLAISDLVELEDVVARTGAAIAVIATPAEAAQAVADRLVYLSPARGCLRRVRRHQEAHGGGRWRHRVPSRSVALGQHGYTIIPSIRMRCTSSRSSDRTRSRRFHLRP